MHIALDGQQKKVIGSVLGIVAVAVLFALLFPTAAARALWSMGFAGAALSLDRDDAYLAFQIGDHYFGQSNGGKVYNPERARGAYEKALAIDPKFPRANYQLSRVLFVQSQLTESLAAVNREIEINPQNVRSRYMRGLIYAYAKEYEKAVPDFEAFIAWSPQNWAGYNDLAWVLGMQGKYAEAEAVLKQGFAAVPNAHVNPWLWNNIGVQQLNLGRYADALASFEHASSTSALLTPEEWHRAYPGNNAAGSEGGIAQFKEAVTLNIEKAREGLR